MVLEVLRFEKEGPKIESAHKERGVWRGSITMTPSVREGAMGREAGGEGGQPRSHALIWREMMGWII